MASSRTKNATRNIIWGLVEKTISLLCPFILRTIIIYYLGKNYLGLNSLFSSILQVLSLAELGFNMAIIYCLYKPLANEDTKGICALLNLYRKIYRVVGIVILSVGLSLIPFLKYLIKGGCPEQMNVYVMYILYLCNTVFSYFFYGYKQALLIAAQRNDLLSKRATVVKLVAFIAQVVLIVLTRNYYFYIIVTTLSTIANNLLNAVITNKIFPNYKCKGQVSSQQRKDIFKNCLSLLGMRISTVVVDSASSLILSAFIGLTAVAVWGNYIYIMQSIIAIITIFFSSLTAGIGNSLALESVDKNYKDFEKITFVNKWIAGVCSICFLCLYTPFMSVWMSGDSEMIYSIGMVVLFSLYFYINQMRKVILVYKDAAGVWRQDKWRPIVVAIVDIILSVILVNLLGSYGVIIAMIIALLISTPWETWSVFRFVFKLKSKNYYLECILHLMITICIGVATWLICSLIKFSGIWLVLICAIISFIIPNICYYFVYRNKKEFRYFMEYVNKIFKLKNKVKEK
jgi:O-antigen/teichoic acid export membrane protein